MKDAKFIVELVNSEGWLKFIGDRNISNTTDAQKYIQKILDTDDFYYNVFEHKKSQEAMGIVTLLKRENERYHDIGFALLPEFEKNGYAIEASKKYLEEIEKTDQYDNVIAITMSENQKSIRLLKKLGLHYKGDYKRDHEILSYYGLKKFKEASG